MKSKENEKLKKENTCRTILNIPLDMNEQFKDLALKRGIAKSQMILFAMGWYLDYSNTIDLMPKMLEALKNSESQLKEDK